MAGTLRTLPLVLVALLGLLAMRASAANLDVGSGRVAAGVAAMTGCDPNGVDVRFALDAAGRITAVALHGLAATCAGGTLKFTLAGESSSLGGGHLTVPAEFDGSALDLVVSGGALPGSVSNIHLAVEGP